MALTLKQLESLQAAAEKMTPGRRYYNLGVLYTDEIAICQTFDKTEEYFPNAANDGAFFAAFDRKVVLALIEEVKTLQEFKAYVHKRLDDAGVPVDPESSHRAEGCRIGGRLDVVLNENADMKQRLEQHRTGLWI